MNDESLTAIPARIKTLLQYEKNKTYAMTAEQKRVLKEWRETLQKRQVVSEEQIAVAAPFLGGEGVKAINPDAKDVKNAEYVPDEVKRYFKEIAETRAKEEKQAKKKKSKK